MSEHGDPQKVRGMALSENLPEVKKIIEDKKIL